MLLRSSLSWATVRPRYSVSRTAVESSKFFVSSATDASFCAMATPCVYETLRGGGASAEASGVALRNEKSSGASARSFIPDQEVRSYTCAGPCFHSASIWCASARRRPAVFGFPPDYRMPRPRPNRRSHCAHREEGRGSQRIPDHDRVARRRASSGGEDDDVRQ